MTSPIPPSIGVERTYGADLRAIGASEVKTTDYYSLTAVFPQNQVHGNASWLLRDTVNSARLVLQNASTTADVQQPSLDGVRALAQRFTGVTGTGLPGGTGPGAELRIYTENEATTTHLKALLRDRLPDGTPITFEAVGKVVAE